MVAGAVSHTAFRQGSFFNADAVAASASNTKATAPRAMINRLVVVSREGLASGLDVCARVCRTRQRREDVQGSLCRSGAKEEVGR
jgi:hypothetical protein